jgi:hypothetical protein
LSRAAALIAPGASRLLAGTYVHAVRLPDNVIDLASRRSRR